MQTAARSKPDRRIPRPLSRRALLKGALGVGVALPWLELMRPRGLRAQSAVDAPKRFGVFFSPCGTIPENWRCATTPMTPDTEFTLSPILEPLAAVQERRRHPARHEHGVVAEQVRPDRQRARPGHDAHADRDRPGEGAGGRRAREPLPRRIGGRPVDRPAHRRGDRRQTRCCRRWSWASRARTRSWRRWSRTCATGRSTRTTSTSARSRSSPSTIPCRSTRA